MVYLIATELAIRHKLWRFERPRLNFDGVWNGHTQYKKLLDGLAAVPFESDHSAQIRQTAMAFSIKPTTSAEYTNWGSVAASLEDEDSLKYLYWVRYDGTDGRFPDSQHCVHGYEDMKVVRRGKRGRPAELAGNFVHCQEGQLPVYAGTVRFIRSEDGKVGPQ